MQAEILTIGTEILLGQIVDTNAAWLAQQLTTIGLNLYRKSTIGDNELRIAAMIQDALLRSEVVITTGGLGPTVDDVTREAVARATGRQLVLDEQLLHFIEAFFQRRGVALAPNNMRQAYIPEGAIPIENPVGTAPAFIVEQNGRYVASVPGVPREMKHLVETRILPFFRERLGLRGLIHTRILHTTGMGESNLDHEIADLEQSSNPTIGLSAHAGQVDIRLGAKADTAAEAEAMLDGIEAQLRQRLGALIYGQDGALLEQVAGQALLQRGVKVVVLETNTGGLIASRLMRVGEGQQVLQEALVLTPDAAISRFGGALAPGSPETWISEENARQIATAYRQMTQADIALAILSDISPGVDPYSKNPGKTYFALATPEQTYSRSFHYGGVHEHTRGWVSNSGLDMLRRYALGLLH
ncbi:MAG: CinA family nicotinamide mononucleotide deamidase-related protein [Chloroflexi bacterium]|nr:CinA family nicotinamide mononucleotide deamidase-related protein [Chloroflexota bacterium]